MSLEQHAAQGKSQGRFSAGKKALAREGYGVGLASGHRSAGKQKEKAFHRFHVPNLRYPSPLAFFLARLVVLVVVYNSQPLLYPHSTLANSSLSI